MLETLCVKYPDDMEARALLEAGRAFRWCLKLEPDNAMAYWGLTRASMLRGLGGNGRPAEMIREAGERKANVTERERLYIEALATEILPDSVLPSFSCSGF